MKRMVRFPLRGPTAGAHQQDEPGCAGPTGGRKLFRRSRSPAALACGRLRRRP